MNPIQMFKLLGDYNKAKSIAKENVSLNTKITQYLVLAGTIAGLFGAWATGWLDSHAGAFTILVGIANVLAHLFPSIFATPSAGAEQKAGLANVKLPLIALALLAAGTMRAQTTAPTAATTALPTSFYAVGASYNPSASPSFASTLLLAKNVSVSGTNQLAFTVVDVLPVNLKTLTVSTNIGVGDAVKLATIAGHTVYAPTSAGVSYTGTNTGWNWTTGVAVPFKIRATNWYAVPNVRVLKSSVSGYQLVPGMLFGWGQ